MTAAALTSITSRVRSWFTSAVDKPIDVLPVRVGGPQYDRPTQTPASVLGLDLALIWVVIGLLAWSLVMVYSASIAMPDNPRFGKIEPYHFLLRHTMSIGMAFVAALLAFQVPIAIWEKVARKLFLLSIFLLVLVLIPHVGTVVNGARRWLSLGIMNFQPSELAKFATLIYAADYMVR
ncbi:MAG: FtsW/RodA/SpoVE family cell cycle protein, partial [Comamonas sp.]